MGAADLINRTLEREGWARARLAAHAGRTVRVAAGPVAATFAIDADGRLCASAAAPDLTLAISPLRLPTLLAQPERWNEIVAADGDAALAATLAELALTLPWFVEAMLARVFGPIAGLRLADLGRRALALPDHAAQRFGDRVARYVADEARLVVDAGELRAFASEVSALAGRADALSARIAALESAAR